MSQQPDLYLSFAVKTEKQAFQLAEWIVISQLKTFLNKFMTYMKICISMQTTGHQGKGNKIDIHRK